MPKPMVDLTQRRFCGLGDGHENFLKIDDPTGRDSDFRDGDARRRRSARSTLNSAARNKADQQSGNLLYPAQLSPLSTSTFLCQKEKFTKINLPKAPNSIIESGLRLTVTRGTVR